MDTMKECIIDAARAGSRLDRCLLKLLPALPRGLAQKFIRTGRVKINGKAAHGDTRLNEGDVIQLFIPEEFLTPAKPKDKLLSSFHWHLNIVYEDENLLLIDKRPGIMVHPDASEKLNTLVMHVRAYLYQKGEYDSMADHAFAPVPCNRIDRFTGGIVMFAKNEAAMRELNQRIRDREIEKDYLCAVYGAMEPPSGMLEGYIFKPENSRKVRVLHIPTNGAQRALTRYKTLRQANGLSLIHCELLTGRTHQIRAQFADAGHPLLGDLQYGGARAQQDSREYQALYAYRVVFAFQSEAGVLESVRGRTFEVKDVPFVREYFPQ